MRSVAVNVGANTNVPGFRGPVYADGSFEYVPIPEPEPTREDADVPTYADLELSDRVDVSAVADEPVHLDPTFADVHGCRRYTYGDPHGVKARPLLDLEAGDHVFFYATLSTVDDDPERWIAPEWGAYVIGHFRLECDPISRATYRDLPADRRAVFENNAHAKREPFDAEVLLYGDAGESALYDVAVPLSSPDAGANANRVVTDRSSDSGRGPWWRRPMKFDEAGTEELLAIHDDREPARALG